VATVKAKAAQKASLMIWSSVLFIVCNFEIGGRWLKVQMGHEMGDGSKLVHTVGIDAAFVSQVHKVSNTSHRAIKAEVVGEDEVGT
jgi:hypothetical protein